MAEEVYADQYVDGKGEIREVKFRRVGGLTEEGLPDEAVRQRQMDKILHAARGGRAPAPVAPAPVAAAPAPVQPAPAPVAPEATPAPAARPATSPREGK